MRFLIDGYNLLHRLGLAGKYLGPRGWERSRADLLAWIKATHQNRRDDITVVFDAEKCPPGAESAKEVQGLHVRFAAGKLADDMLEEMIHREALPRELTVVSSDHRIQEAARRRNCIAMDCESYIDHAIDAGAPPPSPQPIPTKPESESIKETEHWLREFSTIDEDENLRRFNRPFKDFLKDN